MMTRTLGRSNAAISVAILTAIAVFGVGGVALADNIQDSIEGSDDVALVAGSGISGSATLRVVGNSADGAGTDAGCNWDTGESALVLTLVTPVGVTASPNPVSITACGTDVPVSFTAASNAVSGIVTATITSTPAGGGGYNNHVNIPITITQPTPTNTAPTVVVSGVVNGQSYEIGSVPTAMCDVTDLEDGSSSFAAAITGALTNGLGSQTATCDYTDDGGLSAPTATATYSIVDTVKPTIAHALSPAAPDGDNGWYVSPVIVDFTCADVGGSGIASCVGDVTLTDGADQSVTGTATDNAGNTETDTVSGLNVDTTAPFVSLVGGPTGSYYFGSLPAAPTCEATDATSGVASCVISGGGETVGSHSYTATATDNAGNESSVSQSYTVLAWDLSGFYSPVDMGGVWNTVKGGSSVPLKFEIFAGDTEISAVGAVASFKQQQVTCLGSALTDEVELTTTGGTALRYDSTGGQFVQNWATPKKPGTCWAVTMTTDDGSSITANFKLK